MNTQWKALIAPIFSIVFVAGGGWVTLDAVAQQNTELTERVHKVEEKVGQQQVIEVKVQQVLIGTYSVEETIVVELLV